MTQTDFQGLLQRYLAGQTTEAELRLIDRWYDSLNESVAVQFSVAEQARIKARMWASIEAQTGVEPLPETPVVPLLVSGSRSGWRRSWLAVAATVVGVLVGSWFIWRATYQAEQPAGQFTGELAAASAGLLEQTNTTAHAVRLALSDGSSVVLTPKSAVRYPARFAPDHRDVYLTGSAFFSVAKDSRRPFRVLSERVVTQVLGTSFWMKTPPGTNRVDVDVVTGKVSVFARKATTAAPSSTKSSTTPGVATPGESTPGVVLTPNQKVTVFGADLWQTGLVAKPEPIRPGNVPGSAPLAVSMAFEEVALPVVLQSLSMVYGIDMHLANSRLATCTFSGNLTGLPLYTQLDLICRAVDADYAVRGTRILLSGRGCD